MLDIQYIRENKDLVQKNAVAKQCSVDIDHVLKLDADRKRMMSELESMRAERNRVSKEIPALPADQKKAAIEKMADLKKKITSNENGIAPVEEDLKKLLLQIPNMITSDVKVGKDDTENDVIEQGKPTEFSFAPKDHLELGEALDIIDVDRAAKVSGARFAYFKGDAVLLEFALVQFAIDMLIKEGFTPVIPPVLIKKETMEGLGYMENGGSEDMFHLSEDNMVLVGTAEHGLVPMHKNEIFEKDELPKRYVGFSSAFRREAGSYGKDTKGIIRVHQFDKVEMVSFVTADNEDGDLEEHEYLLNIEKKLFSALKIPYQVIKMCSGDLGFPAARKYDIEAWMPGQNKFREVTSVSTVTDFQSRRLNIKYNDNGEKKFVHILNGTAFAIGRTIVAILENYQQKDGSVKVPKVLQKYMGKKVMKGSKLVAPSKKVKKEKK